MTTSDRYDQAGDNIGKDAQPRTVLGQVDLYPRGS